MFTNQILSKRLARKLDEKELIDVAGGVQCVRTIRNGTCRADGSGNLDGTYECDYVLD